jgi:hypothetical protein
MSTPSALVSKLWNYCSILPPARGFGATCRDDGLSFRLRQSILQKAFTSGLCEHSQNRHYQEQRHAS